ncbi:glycosyltransferase [Seonamhaeicola aphaedonensis]|uniref:Colanic acid/amylovoran biosynthesis glycosyltransferase n=1 Tax=Seonamhaeicola aphaedonensis TaxID=1461338 RepID=A0A3D9HHE2_9FLAO|nr:glycosyltransferase [Seonamhaeicola aphaedonensis]RED48376.1 colanic acid/amylovoran biosynthesis glycosyltransferase [Seonamhaeicola aphaedonensis]
MKSLKIAFVVGVFPAISETFIVNQIGALKEQGHQVKIFCTREVNKPPVINPLVTKYKLLKLSTEFTPNGFLKKGKGFLGKFKILLKSSGTKAFFPLLKTFKYLTSGNIDRTNQQFFKVYFKYYLVVHRFDVVHVHFADNAVHLLEQLKRFNGKLVVTFHGYDAHNYPMDFFKELHGLNHINYTVNTNYIKQKVIQLGFPENKIQVLPVGLDTSLFKPECKSKKDSFIILFVGRLIPLKAPLLAIKIVEQLIEITDKKITFYIVGEGDSFFECKTYIEQNSLTEYIHLLGSKSQVEVKKLMDSSDVFLFPGIVDDRGHCEGQGLVIQEAQAMQVPVIVSDVGGMKEGVLDGITGYVLPTKDIKAFVDKLLFLKNNSERRKEMGENGRAFVVKNYDSRFLSEKLVHIYQ